MPDDIIYDGPATGFVDALKGARKAARKAHEDVSFVANGVRLTVGAHSDLNDLRGIYDARVPNPNLRTH